jgi:hypothetical protein
MHVIAPLLPLLLLIALAWSATVAGFDSRPGFNDPPGSI